VLDLNHDANAIDELEIYNFESKNLVKENLPLLKTLGLAFMNSRNPKETDGEDKVKEIFSKEQI
jgi:hypothetical protein